MNLGIVVIAHDMRSTFNVGSLLRTAEGLGVAKVYFTGYTPYPEKEDDERLPHISRKLNEQIEKTALGASKMVNWEYFPDVTEVITRIKQDGYDIMALEQTDASIPLPKYRPAHKVAVILGTEVTGIPPDITRLATVTCEIPMLGKKESFNVVQAAAMALYQLRFHS